MDGASQHRDAVLAYLVTDVPAGDADGTRAGRTQDIDVQVVPPLSRVIDTGDDHRDKASAPVLGAVMGWGQRWVTPSTQSPRPGGRGGAVQMDVTGKDLSSNLCDRSTSALADRHEDRIDLISQFQVNALGELGRIQTPWITR